MFGSTREQYFHAWSSFQFDEATNTIDGYIHKVKQIAALLDTLLSRLYCMLYQINDLRVVVETAKSLLIKEQIDKKAGHSTAVHSCKSIKLPPKKQTKWRRKYPLVLQKQWR